MELTKLQKALTVSVLVDFMKGNEIDIDFKPSEAMKVMSVVIEEVEHLSGKEQDEVGKQAYQDAVRKIYDSLAGESQ